MTITTLRLKSLDLDSFIWSKYPSPNSLISENILTYFHVFFPLI